MSLPLHKKREQLSHSFYGLLKTAMVSNRDSTFHKGVRFPIQDAEVTLGYRSCTLRVNCGLHNGRLKKYLTESAIPQFVPWDCANRPPFVRIDGRWVSIDVAWPHDLQRTDIHIDSMGSAYRADSRYLVIGPDTDGEAIVLPSRQFHHLLIGGQSGSGKTETLRSLFAQLSEKPGPYPRNRLVLVDGKGGEGLRRIDRLPGQVGPLATDLSTTINALGWCVNEMNRRYEIIDQSGGRHLPDDYPHIYIGLDEFQTWTNEMCDATVILLLQILTSRGRAALIHVVGATQRPAVDVFGAKTSTAGQFDAAIGHSVKRHYESSMIVGTNGPRCDTLEMRGDAYFVASVPYQVEQRVQVARFTEQQLLDMNRYELALAQWPEYEVENVDRQVGRRTKPTSAQEWAVGYQAVVEANGVPWMRKQFPDKAPGAGRARTIKQMCQDVLTLLTSKGYELRREQ